MKITLPKEKRLILRGIREAPGIIGSIRGEVRGNGRWNNCLGKDERFNYIENVGQKGPFALGEARLIRSSP